MSLGAKADSVTTRDAYERHSRGALDIVDVRGHDELAEAAVPGAVHIPLPELGARLDELDRDRPVAFVCRSGKRSARAATEAGRAGFEAYNVDGGVLAWRRAGLPLE